VTRWALFAAVPLLAVAAASLAFALRSSSSQEPQTIQSASSSFVTFAPGERPSPPMALRNADGSRFSLASLRGRQVLVTFVDPHCTTFCPRESRVVDDALRRLPASERPAVVAVSVDPTVTSEQVLRNEARRFAWLPQWRWAVGSHAELAKVWKAYQVEVIPTPDDITHTELAYVLDAKGDQRALLLWPFKAAAVTKALAFAASS
jgi:cytochrome oxidase Cu insertion factor (SCO1/SenC/PrrC family)